MGSFYDMSAKVIHGQYHHGANHRHWRSFFQETTGYKVGSPADTRAFAPEGPTIAINPDIGPVPGEIAIPTAIRVYLDGPTPFIRTFRRGLNWLDCKVTHIHGVISSFLRGQ